MEPQLLQRLSWIQVSHKHSHSKSRKSVLQNETQRIVLSLHYFSLRFCASSIILFLRDDNIWFVGWKLRALVERWTPRTWFGCQHLGSSPRLGPWIILNFHNHQYIFPNESNFIVLLPSSFLSHIGFSCPRITIADEFHRDFYHHFLAHYSSPMPYFLDPQNQTNESLLPISCGRNFLEQSSSPFPHCFFCFRLQYFKRSLVFANACTYWWLTCVLLFLFLSHFRRLPSWKFFILMSSQQNFLISSPNISSHETFLGISRFNHWVFMLIDCD